MLTMPNGNSYQGDFKNGRRHGYGVYSCADFTVQGDWVDDLPNGYGTIEWKDG